MQIYAIYANLARGSMGRCYLQWKLYFFRLMLLWPKMIKDATFSSILAGIKLDFGSRFGGFLIFEFFWNRKRKKGERSTRPLVLILCEMMFAERNTIFTFLFVLCFISAGLCGVAGIYKYKYKINTRFMVYLCWIRFL